MNVLVDRGDQGAKCAKTWLTMEYRWKLLSKIKMYCKLPTATWSVQHSVLCMVANNAYAYDINHVPPICHYGTGSRDHSFPWTMEFWAENVCAKFYRIWYLLV